MGDRTRATTVVTSGGGGGGGGGVCNDTCGCPIPCPAGHACRCKAGGTGEEHKTCPCGEHCSCNPCTCERTEASGTNTTTGAACTCGAGCNCHTCAAKA